MSRLRTIGLVAACLLLIAALAGAEGYVVILKSGHKLRCKEPMVIDGPNAIITLSTGTVTSYPLELVDLVETERYNQLGVGDALRIDELTVDGEIAPTPTPPKSLAQYTDLSAGERVAGAPTLGSTVEPTATPTPGIKMQSTQYHDERIDQAFSRIFDEKELLLYRTSQGTKPEYYFVQTVTDSEREVFKALEIVAEAYALIVQMDEQLAPEAVELKMIQTSGKPAGTFRLTPDQARELATGEVATQTFYIKNVIF
jgi:hypothetical protein